MPTSLLRAASGGRAPRLVPSSVGLVVLETRNADPIIACIPRQGRTLGPGAADLAGGRAFDKNIRKAGDVVDLANLASAPPPRLRGLIGDLGTRLDDVLIVVVALGVV